MWLPPLGRGFGRRSLTHQCPQGPAQGWGRAGARESVLWSERSFTNASNSARLEIFLPARTSSELGIRKCEAPAST